MVQKTLKNTLIITMLVVLSLLSYFIFLIYHQPNIDDNFLRRYLTKYPEATIFKPEYLDFFTPDDPLEKQRVIENKRKYIIKGDFNGNGKEEIVISGLLSKKSNKNKIYQGFVLVLERNLWNYKQLFFKEFPKEPKSLIKDLFLLHDSSFGGEINVCFADNSDLISNISWIKGKYEFDWGSESW